MWTHDYFPENWFERDQGEEERYLETASTGKNRMERVLKLGYALTRVRIGYEIRAGPADSYLQSRE
jgi:hypothetical protein